LAALGVSIGIALVGGIVFGFISSKLACGRLELLFEDKEHFAHIEYRDIHEEANEEVELKQVVNTERDERINTGTP